MNPEEKQLLERSLKLIEENNTILHKVEARAKRAVIYGFIKLALFILPFVLGYIFLEPYINQAQNNYKSIQNILNL